MVLSLLAPLHAVRPHSAAPGSNEAKLIKAASDRDLQVAQELLEAEVDVNVIDESNGFTPLHWAAFNGDEKMAQLLLKKEANVNAVDVDGFTPLHRVARMGNEKMAQLLLKAGADVNAVDLDGMTALKIAQASNQTGVADLLRGDKDRADVSSAQAAQSTFEPIPTPVAAKGSNEKNLIDAAMNQDLQKVHELLEAEVDVNAVIAVTGWTALHWAAYWGNEKIAQLLLGRGANVDAVESEGLTPLHMAARMGHANIVDLLKRKGANQTVLDNFGQTASDFQQSIERLGRPRRPRPSAPAKGFTRRQKGLALATLTAVVVGTVGIKLRTYQRTKKILAKKYKLGNLTKLQDTIWLATLLASYRMPWRLHALVRNNPGSLESLVGKDPQALAELYYGHTPSQAELDTFIQTFFAGIE